ncbi:MAG: hypothetical protein ACI86X_000537 [Moritella sp.]|jgi:hypothetical protein
MSKNGISIGIALAFTSFLSSAGAYAPDGRTNGMGNVGVATADYLAAPLYNPALAAVFDDSDDIGILLPAIGLNVKDADGSIETIQDLQDLQDVIDESGNSPSQLDLDRVDLYLDDLADNKEINVTAGVAFAIAIPSNVVSVNLYSRSFVETIADVNVSDKSDAQERYEASTVELTGFGYTELGIALARKYQLYGETFSFGVTPKFQILKTYSDSSTLDDFEMELTDEDATETSGFNFDLGAVWLKNDFRAAIAVQNIISQEIVTKTNMTYELTPQATLGLAYATEYFTVGLDADLTEQTRFVELEDNTQFVRVGMELNAWHWAQLRAGYEHDMQDTMDGAVTAGIGISPFGTVNLDVAASYANENQFGTSANLSFTF